MKTRVLIISGVLVLCCLVALITAGAEDSQIVEINGDVIDLSKVHQEVASRNFSTGTAEVTIREIDASAFPVINVYVDVADSFGVHLCGLEQEDFCVYQDGQRVGFELASLDTAPCPTSVCLVMDVSGSMLGKPLEAAKEAARSFVRRMGPEDRVAIVAYASCVDTVQTFTSDTTILIAAINSLSSSGRTAMFDGFWLGVDLTCPEENVRAVIGYTDGQENNSQACWPPPDGPYDPDSVDNDCALVSSMADDCGFPIYTIGVSRDAWSYPLMCLAENTGGSYFYIPTAEELDSIYAEIQGRLCCRYLFTYTSPDTTKDCTTHQVVVCEGGEACEPCDTGYYKENGPPIIARTLETIRLSETCQPPDQDLVIEATVVDTCPPPVQEVFLFWRITGSGSPYTQVGMTHLGGNLYRAVIPGAALPLGTLGVDYYLAASDGELTTTSPASNAPISPYQIEICPNQPPVITCPEDDSVNAGNPFTSTNYSVTDPDDDPATVVVVLHSVSPSPANSPTLVNSHVEWQTTYGDLTTGPDFTITLIATDPYGAADTCDFVVTVYNLPPEIGCPEDDSIHAGGLFVSGDYSVSDPKAVPVEVALCGVDPTPVNQPVLVPTHVEWQTHCDDAGKLFTICLEATDSCGFKDTCYFDVGVYDQALELTCPENGSVHAGDKFVSTDFATDPEDTPVTYLDIDPSATNAPTIVGDHVEWVTTCQEDGDYTIRLVATGPCGFKDTCEFTVNVYNDPPQLTPPEDDSVHAGNTLISTDFSVSDPEGDPTSVVLLDINPAATHMPTIVGSHVEWITTCDEDGEYVIRLEAGDDCGAKDTAQFTVTVYNRPPELTCPYDAVVPAKDTLVSTDFSVADPDEDPAPVVFLDINPSATNDPEIVGSHVEWVTTLAEQLQDFTIRLVATDPCGLADTCQFLVTVDKPTGVFECPEDDSAHAGVLFISTSFVLTGPGADPSLVSVASVDPPPTNMPVVVGYYVEWQTDCLDTGKVFSICLQAPVPGSEQDLDTCCFEVTVYNRPPELFCPEDGGVFVGDLFVSTDFRTFDPDWDQVLVSILDIDPCPCTDPYLVRNHLEWQTTCCDSGTFYIRLVGVDPCGLKDTCGFWITISDDPPPDFYFWVIPVTQYVSAGKTAEYIVELHSLFGFASPCSLFVSGLPNPPNSGDFDQPVLTPTDWTMLNVHTTVATNLGMYTLTITGKEIGGSVEHDVVIFLEVQEPTDVEDPTDNPNAPKSFALFQNQPNPFNPETNISFALPVRTHASLTIYNIEGKKVRTLASREMDVGTHAVHWNGRDEAGNPVASGIYFYRLKTRHFDQTQKMVLMK
ncbi:MAG: VWA domain-containing protein [Candidatus Zixiibacteriota bacterium]